MKGFAFNMRCSVFPVGLSKKAGRFTNLSGLFLFCYVWYLPNCVIELYCVDQFDESKPSTGNLQKILADVGVAASDVWFIGNSPLKDLAPAKELRMHTMLFDPYAKHGDCEEAEYVIKDLSALMGMMLDDMSHAPA
jgi:FMN phosphatase YigB (HAD superfamily)